MNQLSSNRLEELRNFDTCTVANAIERFNIRPRNEGFMSSAARCRFPALPPVVGHAVTGRIRSYMPPITGKCYYDHIEWWRYVDTIPAPRIVVLQDIDTPPGFGAQFGEIHARISRALNCVAYVTNGAARDLPGIKGLGFQIFSGNVSVSHAYAHVVDFGGSVQIGGLGIRPGDILHGDRHGILSVPAELVGDLPAMAERVLAEDREMSELTGSPEFSVEKLGARLQYFAERQQCK